MTVCSHCFLCTSQSRRSYLISRKLLMCMLAMSFNSYGLLNLSLFVELKSRVRALWNVCACITCSNGGIPPGMRMAPALLSWAAGQGSRISCTHIHRRTSGRQPRRDALCATLSTSIQTAIPPFSTHIQMPLLYHVPPYLSNTYYHLFGFYVDHASPHQIQSEPVAYLRGSRTHRLKFGCVKYLSY